MIRNQNAVIEIFGYWPQFCDARFTHFSYDSSNEIRVTILYIDAEQSKEANIEIVFSGVDEVQLQDLLTYNYIDEVSISNSSPHEVTIEACYGLNGSFKCSAVEVVNVST